MRYFTNTTNKHTLVHENNHDCLLPLAADSTWRCIDAFLDLQIWQRKIKLVAVGVHLSITWHKNKKKKKGAPWQAEDRSLPEFQTG